MNTGDETRDHKVSDPVEHECEAYSREWKNGCGRPVEDFVRARGLNPSELPPNLVPELNKLERWYRERLPTAANTRLYLPGTLIANRYQIEVLLGEGGMGVVYRAFDTTLKKPVALKFLAPHLAADRVWIERFKEEVRRARDVTHKCVARVHDINDREDRPFFSMEYIDGDLSTLLKRSGGRLTQETAARYARQLCLGLAAIHNCGIVHRDLKPQNIMIDGQGQLLITDFGLAVEGTGANRAGVAGTLQYMSPEQARGEPTVQSDIYSLGLVLYEMFVGRQAFGPVTLEQVQQRKVPPDPPSKHNTSLPEEVDDVILKCLQPDPANRPERVENVLHSLLRAGGTPTAEEVAVAELPREERTGGLSLRSGVALFGLTVCCLVLVGELNDHTALFRQALTDQAPRNLTNAAQEHLANLGFGTDAARDSAYGIATDEALLARLRKNKQWNLLTQDQLQAGQPAVMYFWYRRSPDVIAQRLAPNDTSGWSMPGRVLPNEPPLRAPGEVCIFLDLKGRLIELHAVPVYRPSTSPAREPDPTRLLKAAGFDSATLREVDSFTRVPTVYADRRMAWVGAHPKAPEIALRIEAAFYQGEPVYFHVGPDESEIGDRLPGFMPNNLMEKLQEVKNTLLGLVALPIGVWFACRNWNDGRAHPRGAALLAGLFVALGMIGWLLAAHHALWPRNRLDSFKDELSMFTGMLGRVVFDGLLVWLAYLAIEPWVRRTDPESVSSWNRLVQGKWQDPSVGRDILLGCATATGFVSLALLVRALPGWLGHAPDLKSVWDATYTEGAGSLLVTLQIALMVALRGFFLYFLVLLLCRGYVRFGVCLNVAIWWGLYAHGGDYTAVRIAVGLVYAIACFFVLRRAGLLGFIAFNLVEQVLTYMPVTTDFSAWYGAISTMSLAFVLALALYGTWTVGRAQQPADKL